MDNLLDRWEKELKFSKNPVETLLYLTSGRIQGLLKSDMSVITERDLLSMIQVTMDISEFLRIKYSKQN